MKWTVFEMTLPHKHGEAFGCLPSVRIKLRWPRELVNPRLRFGEGLNRSGALEGERVQWDRHEFVVRMFDQANHAVHSVTDLRSEKNIEISQRFPSAVHPQRIGKCRFHLIAHVSRFEDFNC